METVSKELDDQNVVDQSNSMSDFTTQLDDLLDKQRAFFRSGKTRSYEFRKTQLEKLKKLIQDNEKEINQAVQTDLRRTEYVVTFTTGGVITEIQYALERVLQWKPPFVSRRLKHWINPKKVRSPMFMIGSKSYMERVPKGVTLIVGPWNYPFLLIMAPLVGSMAAGNTAVLKPSEYAPNTSNVIAKLINDNFDSSYIHAIEGGVDEAKALVARKDWDHIFFTGGTEIGRAVYQEAAKNLIPVTLELGGKSPTIIDKDVHVKMAARRIVAMKFINNGQTCMAPDYLFVHKEIKEELVTEMKNYLVKFFGDDVSQSTDYARVINKKHFESLEPLINGDGTVITGGDTDINDLYIAPTLIDGVSVDSEIMKDEIFGPILPIIDFETSDEVINFIESRPRPLALYIYTKNKEFKNKILQNTNFGGGMVNDSVIYYLHPELPFGGIGDSGFGAYGGKHTFDEFTHNRPIVETGGIMDRSLETMKIKFFKYPPFNRTKIRLLKFFHRNLSRYRM
ncbi:MAG: aldehyde dehydrogenase family protein [Candidatus Kariarchaeaceae archaeon]|jgi:aldehyde dehydrogenase (NAD+)